MNKSNQEKSLEKMKKQNDLAAGNLLDAMPLKVEQTKVDLSALKGLSQDHPRLLIKKSDLPQLRENIKADSTHCTFGTFLAESVHKYDDRSPLDEPQPYPEETVGKASLWRPYWRQMYVDCQYAMNATRNYCLAGVILEDEALLKSAKAWVLKLASFDPEGVTARAYNDEASFRVIASLAWGYDWLFDILSDEEKALVKDKLIVRLEEIMTYLIETIDLLNHPLNSHGVRSISSAVVPVCIALYGEYEKAAEYLDYAIEYYSVHYPPWGGRDGAWSEGPDYWNTAMAFLGEAFDLIKSYSGINLFNKEFYSNTGEFILHCMPVHSKRASFCDQSSIGDFPGLKLAYNLRHFAGIYGKPQYVWYYDQLKARDKEAHTKFYNYGWWDFGYDDFRFNLLWDNLSAEAPSDEAKLKVFPETGWAAFHKDMTDRDMHIHMIFKSSPFGSISHSHGDQNAFTLHAFGETLASITGYYGGFGVDMHLKWRRLTRSKNLLLIGGKGQYAENRISGYEGHKEHFCLEGGSITDSTCEGDVLSVEGEAAPAYRHFNEDVKSYKRKVWFVNGEFFVIRDRVELDSEQDITWFMHTTFQTETGDSSFAIKGEKSRLDVTFIAPGADAIEYIKPVEGFPDVDPKEYEGMEIHRHVETKFKAARSHEIVTLLVPSRLDSDSPAVEVKREGDSLVAVLGSETFPLN
ncbi:MAG: DUF4962 domain-containing protein [Spirochaetales bacterium]|nr:DUF4962 domain-containing protein [Spirochaetales bacterium]